MSEMPMLLTDEF